MKIRETVVAVSDSDGTVESAKQRFAVFGGRGDIKFSFSIVHPEGEQLKDIRTTLRSLGRKIENGDQLDAFSDRAA